MSGKFRIVRPGSHGILLVQLKIIKIQTVNSNFQATDFNAVYYTALGIRQKIGESGDEKKLTFQTFWHHKYFIFGSIGIGASQCSVSCAPQIALLPETYRKKTLFNQALYHNFENTLKILFIRNERKGESRKAEQFKNIIDLKKQHL